MAIAFFDQCGMVVFVTIPLLKNYEQKHHVEHHEDIIKTSFQRLGHSLSEIKTIKAFYFSYWHSSFILMVFTQLLIWQPPMEVHWA